MGTIRNECNRFKLEYRSPKKCNIYDNPLKPMQLRSIEISAVRKQAAKKALAFEIGADAV